MIKSERASSEKRGREPAEFYMALLLKHHRHDSKSQKDWGLILSPSGRIMGVHSSSNKTPMKSGGFDAISSDFSKATGYSDWKFVYIPPIP